MYAAVSGLASRWETSRWFFVQRSAVVVVFSLTAFSEIQTMQASSRSSHDSVVKLLPPLRCRDTRKEVFVRVDFRPVGFS